MFFKLPFAVSLSVLHMYIYWLELYIYIYIYMYEYTIIGCSPEKWFSLETRCEMNLLNIGIYIYIYSVFHNLSTVDFII